MKGVTPGFPGSLDWAEVEGLLVLADFQVHQRLGSRGFRQYQHRVTLDSRGSPRAAGIRVFLLHLGLVVTQLIAGIRVLVDVPDIQGSVGSLGSVEHLVIVGIRVRADIAVFVAVPDIQDSRDSPRRVQEHQDSADFAEDPVIAGLVQSLGSRGILDFQQQVQGPVDIQDSVGFLGTVGIVDFLGSVG
jgi:hypothetical protein